MRRLLVLLAACHAPSATTPDAASDGGADAPPVAGVTIATTVTSTRFITREHMMASGEMQISGEPLAEAMGRDLGGYSRDVLPVDIYDDPTTHLFWIDLPGFSTGVESYEYSKQPMNELAFELGAGTALPGAAPDVQRFAIASNAIGKWVFPAGTYPTNNASGDINPLATGVPANNPLGWPGLQPTVHVFASFDPAIDPTSTADLQCSIVSDDNPNEPVLPLVGADYECDATTLHLRDRAAQVEPLVTPGADGFATWKYGLWVMNYLQVMHDDANAPVDSVPEAQLAQVGTPGFGTYLGSSDIEGFQAQLLIREIDARASDWLNVLSTDGATLGAIATPSAYGYASPLRWFANVAVGANDAMSLAPGTPPALDLIGMAMGYAEIFAVTDGNNRDVGGAQPARAVFDGDPFSPTQLHDRALAIIRVAVVDLDRMFAHGDVFADDAGGHTTSTVTAAYAVLGLRTVRRSLTSQLELYSNTTPDTAVTGSPLDAVPLAAGLTFSTRLDQLLRAHADLLLDHLTDPSGRAYAGWDLAANAPIDQTDTLDAHTAAVRGLFAAYLATGDTRYRDRAIAVFDRLDAVFYDADARVYGATAAPVTTVDYTPLRFALLQSTLRDVYELVATRPGSDRAPVLEARLARLNKLVLNGWDDRDRDKQIAYPDECTNVVGGLPRGGLQMAERTLTGEVGRLRDEGGVGSGGPPTSDRDQDCVPEIDDAHLPAALAGSITLTVTR